MDPRRPASRRASAGGGPLESSTSPASQVTISSFEDYLRQGGSTGQASSRSTNVARTARPGLQERSSSGSSLKRSLSLQQRPDRSDSHRKRTTGPSPSPPRTMPNVAGSLPHRRVSSTGNSASNPIDLTDSPDQRRPAHVVQRDSSRYHMSRYRSSSTVTLPSWQADDEVMYCPVCSIQFTWYNRKHHCRKCGKVVCANCSQHRITIPRQFIVHPPQTALGHTHRLSLGASDGPAMTALARELGIPPSQLPANLGGGEVVRVCNPCVPDPNLSPPPSSGQSSRNSHAVHRSNFYEDSHVPPQGAPEHGNGRHRPPHIPSRTTSTLNPDESFQTSRRSTSVTGGSFSHHSSTSRHRTGLTDSAGGDGHVARTHRESSITIRPPHRPSSGSTSMNHTRHSQADETLIPPRAGSRVSSSVPTAAGVMPPAGSSSVAADSARHSSRPEIRRRKSAEFCPICNRLLSSLGVNWEDENRRAAHVTDCIESFSSSFYSRPPPARSNTTRVPGSSKPENATAAALRLRAASSSSVVANHGAGSGLFHHTHRAAAAVAPLRISGGHSTHMLTYEATEKDCAASDGNSAECIICMDDFEVGQELGRLECLCKFHKACIKGWWSAREKAGEQGGDCPTHKVNRDLLT